MARLGDVCTIVSGTTPKSSCPEYWDGDINWVTPAELNNESDVIYESQRKITKQAVIDSSLKPFPAGTVLLSSRAPIGKVAIAGTEMYCNQGFKNLICSDAIYNRYLYHYLKNKTEYLNSLGRGATFKEISKSIVEEIEIPLPSLEEQRRIAALLDKVSDLTAKRRQQLYKLDELIKSRFIEFFDACDTYELLQDSNIYISDGNYSSKYPTADEFVEEGVPFIRASNMEMNTIIDDNMYFITREKHAILLKGHVKAGDVLITTRGATIGKIACVPPRHEDSNINAQIVLLRCPKNEYNPLFLSWYLKLKNTQAEIQKLISGSAQPQLPIKRLVQLNLLKPNINLQNQFAAFVEQTEKSKTTICSSLEKLETLKKALMQQYFR